MFLVSICRLGILGPAVELRHLRYFVAVAEMENVSRAALKLHVSQPALSRQIRDLEDELGFSLLERTAKSVRLTDAGRAFLDNARALLQNADEAVTKARAIASAETTELHVGVCVVVAPQHPFARRRAIPIAEVAAEPLIGLTREDYPGYYDYVSMIFSKVKQKPRVVEEYDSYNGIISAVEAGTGVALGADVLGHSLGNRVKFLYLTPEPKPVAVGIIGTKGRLSPAAEKFWQCAKEAASAK